MLLRSIGCACAFAALACLTGCAADASPSDTSSPERTASTKAPLIDPGNLWTCLGFDYDDTLLEDGYSGTFTSRDASTASTLGTRYTGCPVTVHFDETQIGIFANKPHLEIGVGITPRGTNSTMELTVAADRRVWAYTNGAWTSSLVTDILYNGTLKYDPTIFGAGLSFNDTLDLSKGYESVTISANAYTWALEGGIVKLARVSPLPVGVLGRYF
jgi:hypothetical protein